jgi:transcriptional regulator with XRE-family HTH domain
LAMPKRGPSSNEALRIGGRLRRARQEKGLTIEQVARATDLSKGFLSQLERDINSPSIASLLRICETVGIDMASLFTPSQARLVRKDARARWLFGGRGVEDFLLSTTTQSKVLVTESIIEPSGTGGDEPYSLDADVEVVYVLEGCLEIDIDDETVQLEAGDSLTFSPRELHTWRNPSARVGAVAVFVIAPAIYR